MTDPTHPACSDPDPAAREAWDQDLSALLDGELDDARAVELRAHASGCDRCGPRLAAFERVDSLLRATPLPEVPDRIAESLARRLAEDRPAPVTHLDEARRRRWQRAPAIGVVFAAAAALALYLWSRPDPALVPAGEPEAPIAVEPAPPAPTTEPSPPTSIAEAPTTEPEPAIPEPETAVAEVPAPDPTVAETPAPEPPTSIAEAPAPVPPDPAPAPLEEEPPVDLVVALLGVEEEEDLDVIAHLEILERLLLEEAGSG